MSPEERRKQLRILARREEKLIYMLEFIRMRKILLGGPRYHTGNIYISTLNYIRDHPGLTREEIMVIKDIPGYVLTQLNKEGLIYTTEVENRLRKYYIRSPEGL